MRLNTQPAGNVVIAIAKKTGGDDDLSANKTSLTFTTGNWNSPQTVTVSAREDNKTSGAATFEHSVTTGAGADYPISLNISDVTARERDNEGPVQPTINRTDTGNGSVTVYWIVSDDRAEAWQYSYRKASEPLNETWHTANPSWPQTLFHTVGGLENEVRHYFRVRAILTTEGTDPNSPNYVDAVGLPSDEVAATPTDDTLRTAPGNLRAEPGIGEVTLTWNGVAGADKYQYRQKSGGGYGGWQDAGSDASHSVQELETALSTPSG